jgi:hypothetical protein
MTTDLDPLDPLDSPPLTARQQAAAAELIALDRDSLLGRLQALVADTEVGEDLQRAYARNSLRTAGADWRTWRQFCDAAGEPVLPATVDSLRRFLQERIGADRRRSTLDHYLWTLHLVHRLV